MGTESYGHMIDSPKRSEPASRNSREAEENRDTSHTYRQPNTDLLCAQFSGRFYEVYKIRSVIPNSSNSSESSWKKADCTTLATEAFDTKSFCCEEAT